MIVNLFGAPRLTYVGYVSPTQVNFLLPPDTSITAATVQVRNPAGISTAVPLTIQANAPQLFTIDGKNVLGTHANGALLGKAGIVPSSHNDSGSAGRNDRDLRDRHGPHRPGIGPRRSCRPKQRH